jgi:glycolate oxidase FAD binding subunit
MSPLTDLAPFHDVVGADRVRTAEATDAVCGVIPRLVVEPANATELSAALRMANDHGLAVLPAGGRTKLEWGNPPARADVLLSTTRLDQVVEHAWSDLTVTVDAGCTIGALQERLRQHGQRVAVDPLWPERATVGGVLSASDTGALRLKFGGLRDLVIGVTLALPDGTLASSGGKVVKNVAGYDLQKLATGALGTLGVITRAIFRVHPLPPHAATLSSAVEDLATAQRLVNAVLDSKLAPSSLQMRAMAGGRPHVDICYEGNPAGIAAQVDQLARLAPSAPFLPWTSDIWSARQALWASDSRDPIVKISVLPDRVAKTIENVQDLGRALRFEVDVVFQATGIGWIRLRADGVSWPEVFERLRPAVEGGTGSLVILRGAESCERWGQIGDALRIMKAVKAQFDPRQTLNPGRFVGGI